VRLYATFAKLGPSQRAGDPFDMDLKDSASLADLIRKLEIPEDNVHLTIVNGRIIHERTQVLLDADRVALFPPVGGG
jgi:sulfur carrier protein ThiS